MSKERTAFKHPNCGGVILQVVQNDATVFICDHCGESAEDIDRLVIRSLVIIRTSAHRPPAAEKTPGKISRLQSAEPSSAVSDLDS